MVLVITYSVAMMAVFVPVNIFRCLLSNIGMFLNSVRTHVLSLFNLCLSVSIVTVMCILVLIDFMSLEIGLVMRLVVLVHVWLMMRINVGLMMRINVSVTH